MTTRWTTFLAAALATLAACSSATENPDGTNFCGDGTAASPEQCDDGNTISGDGCSATCQSEGSGAVCGDGVVASTEACDDANTAAADGCSATCAVEAGYTCTGMPSTCTLEPAAGGTCAAPSTLTLTDNAGTLEGFGSGDTTGSTNQVAAASCDAFVSGAGVDHIWKFTIPDTRDVVILMDETSAFDTVLRVLSAPCDLATEVSEYGTEDGCSDGEAASEALGYVALPAGTYYVVIDGFEAADQGTYAFELYASATTCGDGVWDFLEFCDDGDTMAGDGCNARCEIEDGYVCDDSEPQVCVLDTGGTGMTPVAGDLVLNEFMAGDNMSDTNCDAQTTGTADEFVELVNVSTKTLDLEGLTVEDSVVIRHTFGAMTLAPGKAIVVWGGGAPACAGVTDFEVASSGQLGLNDDGDTITVKTGGATPATLLTVTYPMPTLNISRNRSPDVTGTVYANHNAVTGAVGTFSPGKRANGTAF